jgi:hypothetical protein
MSKSVSFFINELNLFFLILDIIIQFFSRIKNQGINISLKQINLKKKCFKLINKINKKLITCDIKKRNPFGQITYFSSIKIHHYGKQSIFMFYSIDLSYIHRKIEFTMNFNIPNFR